MKKLRELLFSNLHLKLLALVFALLFWFLATNKEVAETEVTLSVKPLPSEGYRVTDFKPKRITLLVEGYRKELNLLKEKAQVCVKLPKELPAERGWVEVKLSPENLYLGAPVKVKELHPRSIKVKVEKLVKRAVKVELSFPLPRGLTYRLEPNYAVVSLPEELSNLPITVKTEEVELTEVAPPAELVLKLESRFKVQPQQVKLRIEREESK